MPAVLQGADSQKINEPKYSVLRNRNSASPTVRAPDSTEGVACGPLHFHAGCHFFMRGCMVTLRAQQSVTGVLEVSRVAISHGFLHLNDKDRWYGRSSRRVLVWPRYCPGRTSSLLRRRALLYVAAAPVHDSRGRQRLKDHDGGFLRGTSPSRPVGREQTPLVGTLAVL